MGLFDFFSRAKKENLDEGLAISKQSFLSKITRAIVGKSKVDEEVLDQLEEILISSDVGVQTTLKIIERIQNRVSKDKVLNTEELNGILRTEIIGLLAENNAKFDAPNPSPQNDPYVIMVVGVKGVGKTTTIGKLAYQFKKSGKKVVLGAADTFRAAAVDQLIIWSERVGVEIVQQGMNADPASVAFDTLQSAKAQKADVVIIDTAGRLHNKSDLMAELSKVKRVVEKVSPINEVLLVIDATTGQNGLQQAKIFTESVEVTGIVLTKLDGSAKGGVALAIEAELGIPIKWIGTGESETDFAPFNAQSYIAGLLA